MYIHVHTYTHTHSHSQTHQPPPHSTAPQLQPQFQATLTSHSLTQAPPTITPAHPVLAQPLPTLPTLPPGFIRPIFSHVSKSICTMHIVECCGFESHPRQLIFLWNCDCLGCAVLLCFVVYVTLLASFFLPSFCISLICTFTSFSSLPHLSQPPPQMLVAHHPSQGTVPPSPLPPPPPTESGLPFNWRTAKDPQVHGRALCLEYGVSWVRIPPEAPHFSLEK